MPESVTPTIEIWYQDGGQYRFLHNVETSQQENGEHVISAVLDTGIVVYFKDPDGHGTSKEVMTGTLEEAIKEYGEPDEVV